jgi:hypothetical protein
MNLDQSRRHGFEERLLAELRTVVAVRPPVQEAGARGRRSRARQPGWRRRFALVGATAAVLAVAAAAGVPFLTGGSDPAYAVSTNGDGTVTVEINALSDAAGLERKLREAGVPAVVRYLPPGKACKAGWFTVAPANGSGHGTTSGAMQTEQGHVRFTIDPGTLAPDETLVIQTQGAAGADASGPSSIQIAYAKGEVGPCELVDAPAGGAALPPGAVVQTNGAPDAGSQERTVTP